MLDEETLAAQLSEALATDRRIRPSDRSLWVVVTDGALAIEGEVADIASKRRAAAKAAALVGGRPVADRVRVVPAEPMEDGEVRDHVRDALAGEPAFDECRIVLWREGRDEVAHDPGGDARGALSLRIDAGVVELEGHVPSLSHRRLVEVLAWWVPGTRDVRNGLVVLPPEIDHDGEISDAVRLVLEKEPLVDAGQVRIDTRAREVTLIGVVSSEPQRAVSERDAWFVPGVREVANLLAVGSNVP